MSDLTPKLEKFWKLVKRYDKLANTEILKQSKGSVQVARAMMDAQKPKWESELAAARAKRAEATMQLAFLEREKHNEGSPKRTPLPRYN